MITFNELKKRLKNISPDLPKLKVALLGDTATQLLAIALRGEGISRGYNFELYEADYNQIELLVYDQSSDLYEFNPDYVIVFQSTQKLLNKYGNLIDEEKSKIADERLQFVDTLCKSKKSKIIYFNYPEIDDSVFGNYSSKIRLSFVYQIRKLNFELMHLAQTSANFYVCDLLSIQNKYGRDWLFDASIYVNSDMVMSLDALPVVASRTLDIISGIQGSFKKCLILDLDNTLWGGIIGDDGLSNIQLGHGLGIGKVYTEIQQWIKKLKDRGIILAVCSKNDENIAKEPFLHHPEMVLKLDDIAVFVANWETKVDNIIFIQSILNIGFDSMVFLDDNPFERSIVKENIPEICVPELPEDPAEYLEYLYGLNLFETVSFSQNDVARTKQYQDESQRVKFQKSFHNEADFLSSLEMVAEVSAFTSFNIPRVAQLTQRSNQFNLRTIRYTEDELYQLIENANFINFAFSLTDKFGDNGLIGVVILEKMNDKQLFINTWLMSCRVLKRGMEHFMLHSVTTFAYQNGYSEIIAEYIPTPKNKMVESFYCDLGFENTDKNKYILKQNQYKEIKNYITTK